MTKIRYDKKLLKINYLKIDKFDSFNRSVYAAPATQVWLPFS